MIPSRPQVEQIAPDAASLKAAGKVSSAAKWKDVGQGEAALWGVCRGSREYQVRVHLRDMAAKCSCPSRKFPCKHALGLMLLAEASPPVVSPPPRWASDWLQGRRQKAEKKAEAAPPEPLTAEARAAAEDKRERGRQRRLAQREQRVTDGVRGLELWLSDLMRAGLSELDSAPARFFSDRAQALGDAQAPGLRRRVAEIGELPGSGPDWPQRVLDRLGQLALLADAWGREQSLPEPLRTDLRTAVGFPQRKDTAIAQGERVEDSWVVAGQQVEDLELTYSERTWLLGQDSGRRALIVRHARGPTGFGPVLLPGTVFTAVLAFYPSALPLRATFVEREDAMRPALTLPSATLGEGVDPFLGEAAAGYAALPWVGLLPCGLRDVVPLRKGSGWWVRDQAGLGLRLTGPQWTLLAVSGGAPVDLFGEWDGDRLRPLAVAGEHGLRRLDLAAL